jgi:glycosyltransferase involved in cell wall biosynthesis
MNYRVTISLPCFGRPLRTIRAIESIINQDTSGWEAIIMGDNCPHFRLLLNSEYMDQIKKRAKDGGNVINTVDFGETSGGWGYKLTNYAIRHAKGEYLVFLANDDLITPDHLSNYLRIEGTRYEMMYFPSWIDPSSEIRKPKLAPSFIGHSEVIVKTSVAKKAPIHKPKYGHDWDFIYFFVRRGKYKGMEGKPTYHVMHVPNLGTKDVID